MEWVVSSSFRWIVAKCSTHSPIERVAVGKCGNGGVDRCGEVLECIRELDGGISDHKGLWSHPSFGVQHSLERTVRGHRRQLWTAVCTRIGHSYLGDSL